MENTSTFRVKNEFPQNKNRCSDMEEHLIEHVRSYRQLYDPHCREYRNHQMRMEAWEEIGKKLEISASEAKDMWTRLRNSYTNALKRKKTNSSQLARTTVKWKFEEQMSFLEPTLKLRPSRGYMDESGTDEDMNYEQETGFIHGVPLVASYGDLTGGVDRLTFPETSSNSLKSASDDSTLHYPQDNPFHCTSPASPSPPSTPDPPTTSQASPVPREVTKIKRSCLESSVRDMVEIMHENGHSTSRILSVPFSTSYYASDETEMFFLSMARSLKKLSREEQARVKLEISSAVFQAEFRDAQRHQSSSAQSPGHVSSSSFNSSQQSPQSLNLFTGNNNPEYHAEHRLLRELHKHLSSKS